MLKTKTMKTMNMILLLVIGLFLTIWNSLIVNWSHSTDIVGCENSSNLGADCNYNQIGDNFKHNIIGNDFYQETIVDNSAMINS